MEWSDANYTGKAMKMGAGVQGYDAVEAAGAAGLSISPSLNTPHWPITIFINIPLVTLSGECPTVGLVGGYLQGGGHSILSTAYGLAADNLLQYEVVTADGSHLNASRTENSDLFWALSGGGGGTYAIVVSATVKAYPEVTTGGAAITIVSALTSQANFTAAVSAFHSMLPAMIDLGAAVSYQLQSAYFAIDPVTLINSNATYVQEVVLGPWLAKLSELGITPYTQEFTTLSYYEHYATYVGPLPEGHLAVENYQFGSRLITRSLLEGDPDAFNDALANVTATGVVSAGSAAAYTGNVSDQWSAVNPAWRNTLLQLQLTLEWDESQSFEDNVALQTELTDYIVPQFVEITPDSGAYGNEASFMEQDWKATFFGSNYDSLLAVKNKWDPNNLFYAYKGVGSDAWTVAADGRMCKA